MLEDCLSRRSRSSLTACMLDCLFHLCSPLGQSVKLAGLDLYKWHLGCGKIRVGRFPIDGIWAGTFKLTDVLQLVPEQGHSPE